MVAFNLPYKGVSEGTTEDKPMALTGKMPEKSHSKAGRKHLLRKRAGV